MDSGKLLFWQITGLRSQVWWKNVDIWKMVTSLTLIGKFPGHDTDNFLENLSKSFTKHGWVFQKSVCITTRKTEISEKYLDEFSRIFQDTNKG